jgi:hypothetical protein
LRNIFWRCPVSPYVLWLELSKRWINGRTSYVERTPNIIEKLPASFAASLTNADSEMFGRSYLIWLRVMSEEAITSNAIINGKGAPAADTPTPSFFPCKGGAARQAHRARAHFGCRHRSSTPTEGPPRRRRASAHKSQSTGAAFVGWDFCTTHGCCFGLPGSRGARCAGCRAQDATTCALVPLTIKSTGGSRSRCIRAAPSSLARSSEDRSRWLFGGIRLDLMTTIPAPHD